MPLYRPFARKEMKGGGHYYVDAKGKRVVGVTTVCGMWPKPMLVGWAARTAAQYAVDNWDELSGMSNNVKFELIKDAPNQDRDAAAGKGTKVHDFAEHLILGEEVEPPEEIVGHVEAYAKFLDTFKVEPIHTESNVFNYNLGYAGTLDMICRIPSIDDAPILCDIKTTRSGIFGDVALQLSAYANATHISDGETETEMPEIKRAFAIHVRADGADIRELNLDGAFMTFRYLKEIYHAQAVLKKACGEIIEAN